MMSLKRTAPRLIAVTVLLPDFGMNGEGMRSSTPLPITIVPGMTSWPARMRNSGVVPGTTFMMTRFWTEPFSAAIRVRDG